MLTIEEYRQDLLQFVKATAESENEGTVASFVKVCSDALLEAESIPDYEISFYSGTGRRGRALRMDAYAFDSFDGAMYLLVANFSGEKEIKTLIRTDALQVFERARAFAEDALNSKLIDNVEMSTPAYDLIEMLRENIDMIRKFKILLITDMVMSERISALEEGSVNGKPVEFLIWDMTRFYRLYSSTSAREELEIDFCNYAKRGIPCLEASDAITEDCKSYLCIIPGQALADIYDRYGSRLLESNVRSFLSVRGGVNKSIRKTILAEPDKFFVYNNGVAATATEVVVDEQTGQKHVVFAKDLQIVNGGQTTASLSSARYKDKASLDGIFVQMKLTLVKQDNAAEIIPNISRSSNSQNKVKEADFFSNHAYHIRLEEISRRIFAPAVGGAQYETHWYYVRAEGQYIQAQMKMSRQERARFEMQNPKSQVITKTDLAKVINSWQQQPHLVSMGGQTNFVKLANQIIDEWEKHETIFNDNYFKESVALMILFKRIEKLVTIQPWYEAGYRANIVAYSISLLARMIEKKYPGKILDRQRIWQQQSCPEVLDKQMVIITKLVFDAITDPSRETVNVTQWCKRENCWKAVQAIDVAPVEGFDSLLVSAIEHKEVERQAKKERIVDNSIDAQMRVLELGAEYWGRALEWAEHRKIVGPAEITLLRKATKIASGTFPNDKQCDKLLDINEHLLREGFSKK